jgi:hypothetical protein
VVDEMGERRERNGLQSFRESNDILRQRSESGGQGLR